MKVLVLGHKGMLGNAVYKMADAGLLLLVQKKHADFDYEYIAVRK